MRLTIRDARGRIARGETLVRDSSDDAEVIAAAKKVARSAGRSVPSGAVIEVEERAGRRWKWIRDVVA